MALEARLKRYSPFLLLPILWFVLAFVAIDRGAPSALPGSYEFIPFVPEASSHADYSVSPFAQALPPIESDIILEVLRDQMVADAQEPAAVSEPATAPQTGEEEERESSGSAQASTEDSKKGNGQQNGGQGNANGKGNGNKK